jgi:dTDP-4-dehydrorhamnose reductase
MGRAALIGANGQLGSDIARLWPGSAVGGDELIALTHADIDVTDPELLRSVLAGIGPNLVINTAAYHRVDDCEENSLLALQVNALAVKNLAEVCRDLGATVMHFSTDYVFSGRKGAPYRELDGTDPISAYGISKAAGEHFLRYILPEDHILVRSSGLFGVAGASGKGGNFVEAMIRLARDGRPIRVVDDQIATPTFTLDLAATLLEVIAKGGRGTFHITNAGQCSWHEFASEIFRQVGLTPDLQAISSEEYSAKALRPPYSVLENSRLAEVGLKQPRPWREALAVYLRLKGRIPA